MVLDPVCWPHCYTADVVKNGKSAADRQRYRCRNTDSARASFILDDTDRSHMPGVKQQVSDRAMNGSGIRDTVRVLGLSSTTVMAELKNHLRLDSLSRKASGARQELLPTVMRWEWRSPSIIDEIWSVVQSKQ